MSHLFSPQMGSVDAFARYRVSSPTTIFDSKQIADNQPLAWDDAVISGAGTSSTYNANQASTTLAVSNLTAGVRARQTFRSFNYQPGKAMKHGEPVLTPTGWVAIEDVQVGDVVFDGLGYPTNVVGVYPQGQRPIYRITFDDGTHVDCDGEHLWKTTYRNNATLANGHFGEVRVLTVHQMLEECGEEPPAFARWRIPASPVLHMDERTVPVDPYTLGAILGDGHISKPHGSVVLTSADPEIVANLRAEITQHAREKRTPSDAYSYGILGMGPHMRELGLLGKTAYDKFVPNGYKYNAEAVRIGVLQGLMDTDGDVDKRVGTASYTSVSQQLAEDVAYLVRSLGGQAKIKTRTTKFTNADGDRVAGALSYRVSVIMPTCPFRLGRKAFYWKARTRVSFDRYIHTIKPLGEALATCIRVASEDHTFITRNHIVTHNSQLIIMSGVLGANATGIRRRIGQFNASNGLFFEQNASVLSVVRRTFTSGVAVDNAVTQANWNLDKMDGTGASGVTLNPALSQIFFFDYEWLGVGSVRFGFFINGEPIYCHRMDNANVLSLVYMSSPCLPLRYEISNDGTGPVASLVHICSSVISEGGQQQTGVDFGIDRGGTSFVTLNDADVYPLIAMRLKSAYQFAQIRIHELTVVCISTATYRWALLLNPTVVGTAFAFTGITNSAIEADLATTNATKVTGGTQLASGYNDASTSGGAGTVSPIATTDLQLGATIAGVSDILVLAVQRVVGAAETLYGSIAYNETK